jgi:hypothetical protein
MPEKANSSNNSQSQPLIFTPGSFWKLLARSMFKVARKRKNKLVLVVVAAEVDSLKNDGFVKPSQHQ